MVADLQKKQKMKRKAGFGDGDFQVGEDEIEVAEALLLLPFRRYSASLLPHWGRKRPRFATGLETQQKPRFLADGMRSCPSSPLHLRSHNVHKRCNSTPPLAQHMSHQNDAPASAKPKRVKNPQRKRPSRKLTISEWREVLNGRVQENQELRESLEHIRKTFQELREQNKHLKSELCFLRGNLGCNQQQKATECRPSSADENGEKPKSSKDFQRNSHDEYLGRRAVCCSEEDCSTPAMDVASSGLVDLNAPRSQSLFDSIRSDMDGQIALRVNKACIAAEARKRRMQLRRMKSLRSDKLRLR